MKFRELLVESKLYLEKNNCEPINHYSFAEGGKWMAARLKELRNQPPVTFDNELHYSYYGFLKYAICLFVFISSLIIVWYSSIYLIALSIILFYITEVHFLFLFPLLIDKVNNPLRTSIKMTYRIGIWNAVFTVMPIGVFMVIGLLNYKNPFKNWYIGCLAVLIWYRDEIRDRI